MGSKVSSFIRNSPSRQNMPVIVILGTTGSGKSKLAIELARKFDGEIISADSMQVYKGLDIITNKVSAEEQQQAVHHFISCVDSLNRYTVVDFRNRALPLIQDMQKRKKLPIIVGGTNYYIESLLWEVLVQPENTARDQLLYDIEKSLTDKGNLVSFKDKDNFKEAEDKMTATESIDLSDCPIHSVAATENIDIIDCDKNSEDINYTVKDIFKNQITQNSLDEIPSIALHKLLTEVDPAMATTLHPNDRRKVIRSLQIYQQHNCCHSDLLSEQRLQYGGCSLGGPLRFKKSVMLWLQCDQQVLNKRLDERVDQMIENGLIEELLNFHAIYNQNRLTQNLEASYTEGIFQSIGFKEFHNYLILSEEERSSTKGLKMRKNAIADVKLVTRRYARKQIKWIVGRFLKKPDRQLPPVYGLNATDLTTWKESVLQVASNIVDSVIQDKSITVSPLPVEKGLEDVQETHYCDICSKIIVGRRVWEIHIRSRKHNRRKEKLKAMNNDDSSNENT